MALLNPVYGLIVPFLFVVTLPLAIFAGITTTIAFALLMFRVVIVYLDLALHLIPQYFAGGQRGLHALPRGYHGGHALTSPTSAVSISSGQSSPTHSFSRQNGGRYRRRRLSGAGSSGSLGSLTPKSDNGNGNNNNNNNSSGSLQGSMLIPSVGMSRDFEGVGGWRLDDQDDGVWMQINSRLELPMERSSGRGHHWASPSGVPSTPAAEGSWVVMQPAARPRSKDGSPESGNGNGPRGREAPAKERSFVSPNSSRVRTPTAAPHALTAMDREQSYFASPTKQGRKVA